MKVRYVYIDGEIIGGEYYPDSGVFKYRGTQTIVEPDQPKGSYMDFSQAQLAMTLKARNDRRKKLHDDRSKAKAELDKVKAYIESLNSMIDEFDDRMKDVEVAMKLKQEGNTLF